MALGSDEASTATTVYELDGIERFQASLSRDLPRDPEAAKRSALTRIGHLDAGQMASERRAAMGLAKATQYGLERYPAIVFDGRVVVYGVTRLADALDHYRQWKEASTR